MPAHGTFEGSFETRYAIRATRLEVYATEFSLGIRDASHMPSMIVGLELYPFNVGMLTRPFDSAQMKEGFFYSIKGTRLGSYMEHTPGPLDDGVPPYIRPIREFQLHGQYTPDSLTVTIECTTDGICNSSSTENSPISPWIFQVWFRIQRNEMKSFLQFADHNFPYFENKLNNCR